MYWGFCWLFSVALAVMMRRSPGFINGAGLMGLTGSDAGPVDTGCTANDSYGSRHQAGCAIRGSAPPNMRVQRTRSSPSALRSPLTRRPLGGWKPSRGASKPAGVLLIMAGCTAAPARTPAMESLLSPVEIHVPQYPEPGRLARIEGIAKVLVSVRPDGSVQSTSVTKSINPLFDRVSTDAAERWRFSSSRDPAPRTAELTFEFFLWDPGGEVPLSVEAPGPEVILPYYVKVLGRLWMRDKSQPPL